MATFALLSMRRYLRKSLASFNKNKLHGLLAEVDFRNHLQTIGYSNRVSPGGWILRRSRDRFAHRTVVVFPETIEPGTDYEENRNFPQAPLRLHTVCATFQQSGIHAYYCYPKIAKRDTFASITWHGIRLGVPFESQPALYPGVFGDFFVKRNHTYNWLRNKTRVTKVPDSQIPDEFSKEHLRVSFSTEYFAEVSDVDGIFWGEQFTYPLEIKEKTAARSNDLGEWFGLDVGPFAKLAFYAAKRGNLHSLFIVREIDDEETRNLVGWRFIKFDKLAQFASWVHRGGGPGMGGARSAVIRIPKAEFTEVSAEEMAKL